MKRTVRRELIDQWIKEAYPNALSKLSVEAEIPVNSLSKIRLGWIPKNEWTRQRLARALGTTEDELFPTESSKTG